MQFKGKQRKKGFTLIEMAIVTVIIGVMAWGFMSFMTEFTSREKIEEARRDAELAASEIEGFVIGNTGKLPEPRTGNLMPTEIGNTTDPWGNNLLYWRADELAGQAVDSVDSTDMEIRIYTDLTEWQVALNDVGGTDSRGLDWVPTGGQLIQDVAYAVVSPGKDRVQHVAVTSGSIHVNILNDGTLANDAAGTSRNFDDIVQYKTLQQVRTTFANSGITGASQVASPGSVTPVLSLKGGIVDTGPDGLLSDPAYVIPGANVGIVSNTGVGSGQALSMGGGTDDYINATKDTNDYAFETFTIMTWFKTDAAYDPSGDNFGVITSRQNNTGSQRNWWLTIWGGNWQDAVHSQGELGFRAGSSPRYDLGSGAAGIRVDDEQWHFVAVSVREDTVNGGYDAEMYLDGAVVHSEDYGSPPPHGQDYGLYIGSGTHSTSRRFEGLLDEFYIFGSLTEDKSLNATSVDEYYQSSKGSYGY